MYETINNSIAVPVKAIIDSGIISESNYKQLVARNKVKVLQRGCLGTPALADFSSFPERFRRVMETVFGDPKAEKSTNPIDEFLGQDTAAIEFFSSYEVDADRYLPKETIAEYYANACVLNAMRLLLSDRRRMQKMCGGTVKAFWPTIARNVMNIDLSVYPHTLPTNDRRLKDRYNLYLKGGYETLIHKNFCNKNSAKIDDDVKESVIAELMADPRNLDNAQVMRLYNMLAEGMNWKKITASAVATWRDKFDTMIYAGRRGSVAFSNRKGMQVKRSAPTAPLYYWTVDGWDVELLYQKVETNAKTGYNTTTYHHRPTVVVVLDAFNKYPVGYAIGTNESPDLIKAALRNAATHTKQLFGTMYRTHQIQTDHYAIKNLTPTYETVAVHSTPARVKNAKAKIIEPYFKSLNKGYCQLQANWSGFGVTSGKEAQPNNEYLNKYKKNFPEWDGVVMQVVDMIEKERAAKIDQYMAQWSEMHEADKIEFKRESYLLAFGDRTGRKNMMSDNGLKVTIDGLKYEYDCFDLNFREHYSTQWEIRYDPQDLSTVLAVNADESLRFLLTEKYVQPMALKDRKPGDSGQLQKVREFNASLEKQVTDFRSKNIENMASVMPILMQNDTLQKLMICDSHGQHKDRRNDGRALNAAPKLRKGSIEIQADDDETDFRNLY
jgi:hypothetical protein